MVEYGIFNDEGMIEGQFVSAGEAADAMADRYSDDEWAAVFMICPDHAEQPAYGCGYCATY